MSGTDRHRMIPHDVAPGATSFLEMLLKLNAVRKSRRIPGKSRRSSRGRGPWRWLLPIVVVVIIAGIGLVKWAGTRPGQAALLTLGSPRAYPEVQAAVEDALLAVLPDLPAGPAALRSAEGNSAGADCDWPAAGLGPGAAVRCRSVGVSADLSWWALQDRIVEALDPAGARVLWGERLFPAGSANAQPDEHRDLLRLDVGVPGRPTHTLVLYREGTRPVIRWGAEGALTLWESLAADPRPTIALVIDDWGNNTNSPTKTVLGLDIPLTMSVLPGRPFSRKFALEGTELILPPDRDGNVAPAGQDEATAQRMAAGCPVEVRVGRSRQSLSPRRREIILHLPMEPQDYPENDPGAGALMVGMKESEISSLLEQDLRGLPPVAGLNNHMGSAATSDEPTMRALMKVLKKRHFYFLDSLTSANSVAYRTAREAGLQALRNRTFLDYDQESPERIRANLNLLAASARKSGFVVGIGHPHPATARVLAEEIPRLQREGIRFVTVSELLALQHAAVGGTP